MLPDLHNLNSWLCHLWENGNSWSTQEIPQFLWNPEVYHQFTKSQAQMNPFLILIPPTYCDSFYYYPPATHRYFEKSLPFSFYNQNSWYIFGMLCVCYVFCSSYSPWFDFKLWSFALRRLKGNKRFIKEVVLFLHLFWSHVTCYYICRSEKSVWHVVSRQLFLICHPLESFTWVGQMRRRQQTGCSLLIQTVHLAGRSILVC